MTSSSFASGIVLRRSWHSSRRLLIITVVVGCGVVVDIDDGGGNNGDEAFESATPVAVVVDVLIESFFSEFGRGILSKVVVDGISIFESDEVLDQTSKGHQIWACNFTTPNKL